MSQMESPAGWNKEAGPESALCDAPGAGEGEALRMEAARLAELDAREKEALLARVESGSARLERARLAPGESDPSGLFELALKERELARGQSCSSRRGLAALEALLEAGWARLDANPTGWGLGAKAMVSACSGRDLALLELALGAGAPAHWEPGEHFFKTPIGRCVEKHWEAGARALGARLTPASFGQRSLSGMGFFEALFACHDAKVWARRSAWAVDVARGWIQAGADVEARAARPCCI